MRKVLKKELIELSVVELQERAVEIRKELFVLRMKKFSAPIKDVHMMRNLRKSLACVLTFMQQKQS
jgi:ribosomal protein L29